VRTFRSASAPHEQINRDERKNPEQHQQRVVLDETGLETPEPVARFLRRPADQVDGAVDDDAIRQARQPRAEHREEAGPIHRAVDHVAIEGPQAAPDANVPEMTVAL
jgi:hypothetical protein